MGDTPTHRYGSPLGRSPLLSPLLWAIVVVFFGAGDLFTTALGLSSGYATEAGPIVRVAIESVGLFGIVPIKLVSLGLAYLIWRRVPKPQAFAVPLGFGVVGILITAWNVQIIMATGLL